MKKGDLVIRDLGYMAVDSLTEIDRKGACYLTRHLDRRILCCAGGERVDLLSYLRKYAPDEGDETDLNVVLSGKLSCRLIARRVPEEIEKRRLRKIHKEEKRLNKKRSKEYLKLQRWEIYLTNLPKEEVSVRKGCELYRLRWRIETIFKAVKSKTWSADLTGHNTNKNHVQVLILAWLCLVVKASQAGVFEMFMRAGEVCLENSSSLLKALKKAFEILMPEMQAGITDSQIELTKRMKEQSRYHDRYERRQDRENMVELANKVLCLC